MVDRSFSLTLAVQTIAREAGCEIDIDDLHAALGLPLLTCAVPAQLDVACWPLYARDAFLMPAGRLFGMNIRDLHPPEAALGLSGAAEFAQHFDASYRPLVERALENDQPVLAWQGWGGWPHHQGLTWGIIRGTCDDGIGLAGVIPGMPDTPDPGKTTALVTPPVQLYVVEGVTLESPDSGELLDMSLDHAYRAFRGEATARFGMLAGAAALHFWVDRIRSHRGAVPVHPTFARGHHALATSVVAGHQSAIRSFEQHLGAGSGAYDSVLRPVIELCKRIVASLRVSTDWSAMETLMGTLEGRGRLIADVIAAERDSVDVLAMLGKTADGK